MTETSSSYSDPQSAPWETSTPDPAFQRFERLIGKWELRGRTLDSKEDNITGWSTFEWLPGGFFLKTEGEINFKGALMRSLEIIAYDPTRKVFPAKVYTSFSGDIFSYEWDIQGDTLIHAGLGAKYTGAFSADGNTITGGWRPDEGTPVTDGTTYDAVMKRI